VVLVNILTLKLTVYLEGLPHIGEGGLTPDQGRILEMNSILTAHQLRFMAMWGVA